MAYLKKIQKVTPNKLKNMDKDAYDDLEEKLDTIKNLEGKLDAILNNQDQFRLKMDQIERKLEETQTEMVSVKQDASDMKKK